MSLADEWRAARPKVSGVHVDSAACSRQSHAVIDAATRHAHHEAEVGGYVAAEAAAERLDAGRAVIAELTGLAAADVIYTTSASDALDRLLSSWAGERTLACLPGEFGPNLAVMAANGFEVRPLPVDGIGRLDVDAAARALAADPPALVHLTALASHRGIAQPIGAATDVCRDLGVPVVIDAAQAFGHLDCALAPDAVYGTSRKWIAGPRGVGFLAVSPALTQRLRPRIPPPEWGLEAPVLSLLELGETNVAARVAFSVALDEYVAFGPARIRARLAEVGALTRRRLAEVPGWRVIEPIDEPTAITTIEPLGGADPQRVRAELIAEHGIVTTFADVHRAPFELTAPVLRISPHVDVTAAELDQVADALARYR
jgi:pyridoxal 5-phosphate dependent beta-lyase